METRTVVQMFRSRCAQSPERVALRERRAGRWTDSTYAQWLEDAIAVAAGLISLGVEPGDRVGIMASTRRDWVVCDLAIMCAGAVTVPIYQTAPTADAGHVLFDAGAVVAIAEDLRDVEVLLSAREAAPMLRRVVVLDMNKRLAAPDRRGRIDLSVDTALSIDTAMSLADREAVISVDALRQAGVSCRTADPDCVARRMEAIRPSDLCTIVYTSGTTGRPRGVELTHGQVVAAAQSLSVAPIGPEDVQLLMLPLAHIFGRVLVVAQLQSGFQTAFARGPQTAVDDAGEIRPTFIASVPRLYEKVHAVALAGARASGHLKERIFDWALGVGGQVAQLRHKGNAPAGLMGVQYRYAQKLVFNQIRQRFGGRIRFFFSGAAPLSQATADFFESVGFLLLEGYGLTESSAVATCNLPEARRRGTVGRALPGVQLRVAADGEILLRGPNVMRGYWNRPEDTAAALDVDGWLHTGDVGVLDADGFLRITDRKKDLIVTSGGKNIAPQNIEALLRESALVRQAVLLGDRRPYPVALFTLDEEAVRAWAGQEGLGGRLVADLAQSSELGAALQVHVDSVNVRLAPHERIRTFAVLPRDLSLEAGELTPTHKVNRGVVAGNHAELIDSLYSDGSGTT